MKTLINKAASIVTSVVLFAFGCVIAGLGLAAMSVLVLFAMSAVGVALLASPIVAMAQASETNADDTVDTATTA